LTDGAAPATNAPARRGSPAEVFGAFLKLGLTSFGGPIAHLGYFRDELVIRRRWIDEDGYADLAALCQFLPGPASSQVGFALGILRGGGLIGGFAAWAAFTLPSALLLVAFAYGAASFDGPVASGVLHGLKLVAVAVVAQAVWGMARTLAPDRPRASIAVLALFVVVFATGSAAQIAAIALGAVAGAVLCRTDAAPDARRLAFPISRRAGAIALGAFVVLLVAPHLLAEASQSQGVALFDAFYRSGALVFGGGHVVLPLLQSATVGSGWTTPDVFLAGYGAAQAVPGPLFAFAAYLGAVVQPAPNGLAGAALALAGIFLPGLLLVFGALPFWDIFRARPLVRAAMRGANAAVVGVLAAALYDPVWTSAIGGPRDFALAALGFVLLTVFKAPPWSVVALGVAGGVALALA
jgi:chromate transporter